MATILEFRLPVKAPAQQLASDRAIYSSINDLMLIIHHALHGADEECCPKDLKLAAKLLDELSCHIKGDENDHIMLSHAASSAIVDRYPEVDHSQNGS